MNPVIFDIEYSGADMEGKPITGTRRYPAYSCGHCSSTVILRPDRTRQRLTCNKCGRWLCEKNELCRHDCTPLYSIVRDKAWSEDNKWTRLLPAIMGGVTTKAHARALGLMKE
jgi:hypothetical protein